MNTKIEDTLSKLKDFQGRGLPVFSVYLNTQANANGRTNVGPFLRSELAAAVKSLPENSEQRASAEADRDRILEYVEQELKPETNTLALFVCQQGGLFEALQLAAEGTQNRVYSTGRPQVYPLLLMQDTTPRCAVVQVDRRNARILVIGEIGLMDHDMVKGDRISHVKAGGWSQARYQRHVKEISDAHLREVADHLAEVCKADLIQAIVLAGDDVIVPQFQALLPSELADKVIDTMRVEAHAPEHALAERARQALLEHDAQTDRATVEALKDAARGGGLGVVGHKETHLALQRGQVNELVVSSALRDQRPGQAEAFARLAIETGAKVSFIEDADLLADCDGVGALLRFKLDANQTAA